MSSYFPILPFLSLSLLSFSSPPPELNKGSRCIVYEQPVFSRCTKGKNIIEATRQATFLLAEYNGERQEEEGDVCMCVGVEEEELC